jgi:hypothetical protein
MSAITHREGVVSAQMCELFVEEETEKIIKKIQSSVI